MDNLKNIHNWLIHWFSENTEIDAQEIARHKDANYFEMSWIDSFKFINLVMEIESFYNISFANNEFQNREFVTISGLGEIIKQKKLAKDNGAPLHL